MISKSEAYAIRDGVEIQKRSFGRRGFLNVYIIPCQKCGKTFERRVYNGDKYNICDYCKSTINKKKKEIQQLEIDKYRSKKERAFDKAVEKIKEQVKDFEKYENAIKIAETRAESYGSIPEAMVAIELLKLKYRIIPQQKINQYTVDFAIPAQKLIIEVDGALYHKNKPKKAERELSIQYAVGLDWVIVHVPAELIAKEITKLQRVIDGKIKQDIIDRKIKR